MIAWKNGNFNFIHTNLESTMRQLARWYDVAVVYRGKPAHYDFVGDISRSSTLEDILRALERYGVHTRLEGRTIIVLP
jgi:Ni,Fe-hydrogenase III large subunit